MAGDYGRLIHFQELLLVEAIVVQVAQPELLENGLNLHRGIRSRCEVKAKDLHGFSRLNDSSLAINKIGSCLISARVRDGHQECFQGVQLYSL